MAVFRGFIVPSQFRPAKGGGLDLRLVVDLHRVHERQGDLEDLTRMMAEGAEVQVTITPSVQQVPIFRDAAELEPIKEPEEEPAPQVSDAVVEEPDDGPALRYVGSWEETRLALYETSDPMTADELADAAWDRKLHECMIQVKRMTTRGDRAITHQTLYRWRPEERRVQRIPQHSVQTLIRELRGEDQEERRATG